MHRWSKEEIEFLKKIASGNSYCKIQEMFNKKFVLNISLSQISSVLKRYGIKNGVSAKLKKGRIPWNKNTKGLTKANRMSFKKGHTPFNQLPVGTKKIKKDGYIWVKVADPKKWKQEHKLIWEEERGKVPSNCVIAFKDGNRLNTKIENLMLVKRSELAIMNHLNLNILKNEKNAKTKLYIVKLLLAINKAKKKIN